MRQVRLCPFYTSFRALPARAYPILCHNTKNTRRIVALIQERAKGEAEAETTSTREAEIDPKRSVCPGTGGGRDSMFRWRCGNTTGQVEEPWDLPD